MAYQKVDQSTTAESKQSVIEKENVVQRPTAISTLASLGGDPHTQTANLHQQTGGKFYRAGSALLQLQNQYGNHYVQQLINPQQRLTVQTKLMLGDVDTPSEREADQIASQTASGQVTTAPTPVNGATMPVSPETEHAIEQARGGGHPLPHATQTRMGQALSTDLSGVRVHTDDRANSLNQSLQAKAFTSGNDIFFRQGAYNPGSSGQQLLAHELSHVAQQNQSHSVIQRKIYAAEKVGHSGKVILPKAAYNHLLRLNIPDRIASTLTKWYGNSDKDDITLRDLILKAKAAAHKATSVKKAAHKPAYREEALAWEEAETMQGSNQAKSPNIANWNLPPLAWQPPPAPQISGGSEEAEWEEKNTIQGSTPATGLNPAKARNLPPIGLPPLPKIDGSGSSEESSSRMQELFFDKSDYRTYFSDHEMRKDFYKQEGDTTELVTEALEADELQYLKHIPMEDLQAINYYQGSAYAAMNQFLRENTTTDINAPKANLLASSGLNQLPPVVGTVYRGVKLSFARAEQYGYLNIGGMQTEKGFLSTTIDNRYWPPSRFGNGRVGFQIESKGGAKDLRAIASTGVQTEDELIFAPHSQFKVLGITPLTETISNENKDKFPAKPTVTTPVKANDLEKQYQSMVIYLEENPSATQTKMYDELTRQYGPAVNIDWATKISNLLHPIYIKLYPDNCLISDDTIERKYHSFVLPAVKRISADSVLAKQVVDKLQSGNVASLNALAAEHELIKTLLARWDVLIDMVQKDIQLKREAVIAKQKAEQADKEKLALSNQKKQNVAEQIASDDNIRQSMLDWISHNSDKKPSKQWAQLKIVAEAAGYGKISQAVANRTMKLIIAQGK